MNQINYENIKNIIISGDSSFHVVIQCFDESLLNLNHFNIPYFVPFERAISFAKELTKHCNDLGFYPSTSIVWG